MRRDVAAEELPKQGGLELVLAPIMAAALFLTALVSTLRKRPEREPEVTAQPHTCSAMKTSKFRPRLERVPVLRTVLAVQQRYGEIKGGTSPRPLRSKPSFRCSRCCSS